MEPTEILSHVRTLIRQHAGDDPDKWWYANRYVYARLQLDERGTKAGVKQRLMEARKPCYGCGRPFSETKGIALHRLDSSKGYSDANCAMMHADCHERLHAEAHQKAPGPAGEQVVGQSADPVLAKESKRYDGSFLYWWDITPNLAVSLDRYEVVAFSCKDSGAYCVVPVLELKRVLTSDRQTARGAGHWGIKVLKDRENELAFEPGTGRKDWVFLPATWEGEHELD